MTQRRALGDPDVDSAFDDPDNGWFGHNQAVDPMSSRAHLDRIDEQPAAEPQEDLGPISTEDTDRWPVATLDTTPAPEYVDVPEVVDVPRDDATRWAGVAAPSHRRVGASASAASPSWESRLSGSGAWDFKVSGSSSRHHSRFAVLAVIAAVLAVVGGVLLLRSPGQAVDESPVVSPNESSAQPVPPSAAPALTATSAAPLPPGLPPPPPPPPPPTAEQINPPEATRVYTPRRQAPESNKPQINVTRTPVPRAPTGATRAPDPSPWGWR